MKNLFIILTTLILIGFISCRESVEHTEKETTAEQVNQNIEIDMQTTQTDYDFSTSLEDELQAFMNDPSIDEYYKETLRKGKLIHASDDNIMLSITDSLWTKDSEKALFYFLVFTKSMYGSDGFYSEALGLSTLSFIETNTETFADYFNVAPFLNERDMDNWANYISGEIQISNENNEMEAFYQLEEKLTNNIKESKKESQTLIKNFIQKIRDTLIQNLELADFDDQNMDVYIVVADTSADYYSLRKKMFELNSKLGYDIDTMDRSYNSTKDLICLPENHPDDIYAGDYFPRRYPTETLSLEYVNFYNTQLSDKTIGLVTGIFDDEKKAEKKLNIIKSHSKNAFIINTNLYMGCMH
jgi:hypothetical protein